MPTERTYRRLCALELTFDTDAFGREKPAADPAQRQAVLGQHPQIGDGTCHCYIIALTPIWVAPRRFGPRYDDLDRRKAQQRYDMIEKRAFLRDAFDQCQPQLGA